MVVLLPLKKGRDYKLEVEICDHALDVTRKLFKHTHIYKPDYLTFWWGIRLHYDSRKLR